MEHGREHCITIICCFWSCMLLTGSHSPACSNLQGVPRIASRCSPDAREGVENRWTGRTWFHAALPTCLQLSIDCACLTSSQSSFRTSAIESNHEQQ